MISLENYRLLLASSLTLRESLSRYEDCISDLNRSTMTARSILAAIAMLVAMSDDEISALSEDQYQEMFASLQGTLQVTVPTSVGDGVGSGSFFTLSVSENESPRRLSIAVAGTIVCSLIWDEDHWVRSINQTVWNEYVDDFVIILRDGSRTTFSDVCAGITGCCDMWNVALTAINLARNGQLHVSDLKSALDAYGQMNSEAGLQMFSEIVSRMDSDGKGGMLPAIFNAKLSGLATVTETAGGFSYTFPDYFVNTTYFLGFSSIGPAIGAIVSLLLTTIEPVIGAISYMVTYGLSSLSAVIDAIDGTKAKIVSDPDINVFAQCRKKSKLAASSLPVSITSLGTPKMYVTPFSRTLFTPADETAEYWFVQEFITPCFPADGSTCSAIYSHAALFTSLPTISGFDGNGLGPVIKYQVQNRDTLEAKSLLLDDLANDSTKLYYPTPADDERIWQMGVIWSSLMVDVLAGRADQQEELARSFTLHFEGPTLGDASGWFFSGGTTLAQRLVMLAVYTFSIDAWLSYVPGSSVAQGSATELLAAGYHRFNSGGYQNFELRNLQRSGQLSWRGITNDWFNYQPLSDVMNWAWNTFGSWSGLDLPDDQVSWYAPTQLDMTWCRDYNPSVYPPTQSVSIYARAAWTMVVVATAVAAAIAVRAVLRRKLATMGARRVAELKAKYAKWEQNPTDDNFTDLYVSSRRYNWFSRLFGLGTFNPINGWMDNSASAGLLAALANSTGNVSSDVTAVQTTTKDIYRVITGHNP